MECRVIVAVLRCSVLWWCWDRVYLDTPHLSARACRLVMIPMPFVSRARDTAWHFTADGKAVAVDHCHRLPFPLPLPFTVHSISGCNVRARPTHTPLSFWGQVMQVICACLAHAAGRDDNKTNRL